MWHNAIVPVRCGYPLRNGRLCRQQVKTGSEKCAAGHFCNVHLPDGAISMGACRMKRQGSGWVCEAHDIDSPEWQVLLALGAKVPCRLPGNSVDHEAWLFYPDLPHSTWRLLLKEIVEDPSRKKHWLALGVWPEDLLREVFAVTKDLAVMAMHSSAFPADLHHQAALSSNEKVRAGAASTSATVDDLVLLSQDDTAIVRRAAASNPNTPGKVLEQLATSDSSETVRERAIRNRALPKSVLERLSMDEASFPNLLRTARCPEHVFHTVFEKKLVDLWPLMTRNSACPATLLSQVLKTAERADGIQKNVALHSACPTDTLRWLSRHGLTASVRAAARSSIRYRKKYLFLPRT